MRISDWSSDVCSSDLFLFEKSRDTVCAGTEIPCQSQVAQAHQLDARTLFRRGLSNLGTKRFDQRRRLRPWRLHVALLDFDDPRFQVWVCPRSEEHTSELQSLMRISYADFCLKKQTQNK